jgi:hypothetical protein
MPISSEVESFLEHASQDTSSDAIQSPLSQVMFDQIVELLFEDGGLIEDWTCFDHRARIEYLAAQFGLSASEYCQKLLVTDRLTALSIHWNVIGRQLGESKVRFVASSRRELEEKSTSAKIALSADEKTVLEHLALSS